MGIEGVELRKTDKPQKSYTLYYNRRIQNNDNLCSRISQKKENRQMQTNDAER
jgi:hypothetical protein